MNKLLTMLVALAFSASVQALPVSHKDSRNLLNTSSPNAMAKTQLGSQIINSKVHLLRATYSFAAQGGSTASVIDMYDYNGKPAKLPSGAIIKQVTLLTRTQPVSTVKPTTATLAFSAQSAADLKAAATVGAYVTGLAAGIPDGDLANMIQLTAERTVQLTVAVGDLTAGAIDLLIEYYLTD